MKRIAVFIDGGNFFFLQRDELRWWVDPKRLLAWIGKSGEIVEAMYYAGYDPGDINQLGFLKALPFMGFSVVSKEIKLIESYGQQIKKANMDCELVADIFLMRESYDELYLVSGDTDFAGTLSRVRSIGKTFKVVSSGRFIASEMREIAGSHLIDFQDIRNHVEKQPNLLRNCHK